jgi:hypothetical protein
MDPLDALTLGILLFVVLGGSGYVYWRRWQSLSSFQPEIRAAYYQQRLGHIGVILLVILTTVLVRIDLMLAAFGVGMLTHTYFFRHQPMLYLGRYNLTYRRVDDHWAGVLRAGQVVLAIGCIGYSVYLMWLNPVAVSLLQLLEKR